MHNTLLYVLLASILFCQSGSDVKLQIVTQKMQDGLIVINLDSINEGAAVALDSIFSGYSYIVNKYGVSFNANHGLNNILCDEKGNIIETDALSGIIKLYDNKGDFLRCIGKRGTNPDKGQYYVKMCVKVGIGYGYVYVVDQQHSVIQKYSYKGDYVGRIQILSADVKKYPKSSNYFGNSLCDAVIPLPDGKMIVHYSYWAGNLPYNFCIVNSSGTLINTKQTMGHYTGKRSESLSEYQCRHYYYNNHLYLKDLSDTIYMLKGDAFVPKYVFQHNNSLSKIIDDFGSDFNMFEIKRPLIVFSSIQETRDYLFFSYFSFPPFKNNISGYYNKTTGKVYKLSDETLKQHLRFANQKDTTDFVYPTVSFIQTLSNDCVMGIGKMGRARLYLREDQK